MMTNYDYWANHTFLRGPQPTEKAVIDYLLSEAKSPYSHDISDLSARITLSALALLGDKEYARSGTHRKPGGLGNLYQSQRLQSYLNAQLQNYCSLLETAPDISILPTGSFSISFQFTLSSPYISRDDTAFHLLDNPVKKEWVFKLPYVAAPQWKGALRAAIRQMKKPDKVESELLRLFGTANDADNSGKRGCLYFYPSFFDQISLEVINPHDRETGAGSQPIYFEAVTAGATATFTLLYVPLYPVDKDVSDPRRPVATDIQLVADGIQKMLTLYGFGAKTSSGFGLAELDKAGQLTIHYPDKEVPQPKPLAPVCPEMVQSFLAEYPQEYLDMKPKQLKDAGVPNLMRQQIKEIKALYQQYQQDLALYEEQLAEWEAIDETPVPPITSRLFTSFASLQEVIAGLSCFKELSL